MVTKLTRNGNVLSVVGGVFLINVVELLVVGIHQASESLHHWIRIERHLIQKLQNPEQEKWGKIEREAESNKQKEAERDRTLVNEVDS